MLRDKQVESFEWIFTKFVQMLGNVAPKTILTGEFCIRPA
jgi:hypothetical protein